MSHEQGKLSSAAFDSSLALGIIGDLAGWADVRRWGGMLNGIALLLFLAVTVLALRRGAQAAAKDL